MTNEVLDSLDRQAADAYRELACRMAQGHELTPEEINPVLADADKSRHDLRADVAKLTARYNEVQSLRNAGNAERQRQLADKELAELKTGLTAFIDERNREERKLRDAIREKQNEERRLAEASVHAISSRAYLQQTASTLTTAQLAEQRKERTDLLERHRQLSLRLEAKSYNPAVPGGQWVQYKTEKTLRDREASLVESIRYMGETGGDSSQLQNELIEVQRGLDQYASLHKQHDELAGQIAETESAIVKLESQLWDWRCADLTGAVETDRTVRPLTEREQWARDFGEREITVAM